MPISRHKVGDDKSTQTSEKEETKITDINSLSRNATARKASEVIGPQLSKETRNFLDRDDKKGWRDFVSFCVFADRIGHI